MNDTPAHVEQLYHDMLMSRSGAERLWMACGMFETAQALIRASLGAPAGLADSAEMRVRLFLRIYGRGFDARTAARIVAHLRGCEGLCLKSRRRQFSFRHSGNL